MRHRFTTPKGQTLEVRDRADSHSGFRLYHITTRQRGIKGKNNPVEVQERLDDQPLRPAVGTALLQEIIRLAKVNIKHERLIACVPDHEVDRATLDLGS